jgi:hypothetical protein
MAKAAGKRVGNWLRNQSTKELIAEFENLTYSDPSKLKPALITQQGKYGGGTWAHPDIAIQFAQWCSPGFALQVSRWVREWLTSGKAPVASESEELEFSKGEFCDLYCKAKVALALFDFEKAYPSGLAGAIAAFEHLYKQHLICLPHYVYQLLPNLDRKSLRILYTLFCKDPSMVEMGKAIRALGERKPNVKKVRQEFPYYV